ncbi:photosystem II protein Y [Alkalinema pantanalense CENA528]
MDLDFRVLAVLAPVGLALGWAVFNIFRAAQQQLDNFLNKRA